MPRRPRIIRRWNGDEQQYKLRRVLRCVLVLPLVYLLVERLLVFPNERISGYLHVETVAATTTTKTTVQLTPTQTRTSLETITQPFRVTDTASWHCPVAGTQSIHGYYHHPNGTSTTTTTRRIPTIFHRQGPTRCVSSALYNLNEEWKNRLVTESRWSVYFHTEDAMTRLFRAIATVPPPTASVAARSIVRGNEFPHLGPILKGCVENRSIAKRVVWRFLCLYVFGGVYIDLDYKPNSDAIRAILAESNDAFILVRDNNLLDPGILAVSPRHPLMYYAVHHALWMVLANEMEETSNTNLDRIVSDILQLSLADFFGGREMQEHDTGRTILTLAHSTKDDRTVTMYLPPGSSVDVVRNMAKTRPRSFDSIHSILVDNGSSTKRDCLVAMLQDVYTKT